MRLLTLPRLLALVALIALSVAPQAAAATIRYVELTGSDSGNAACTSNAPCATIAYAVAIADAGDTIKIGKGNFYETNGVSIDKKLTITGSGVFGTRVLASPWGASRVFTVAATGDVTMRDLMVLRGNGDHGGGIQNSGKLELEDVWVRENKAGGGIWNGGYLKMTRGEIALNKGGGLYNLGTAALSDVRIAANSGFGIHSSAIDSSNVLVVENTTIAENQGAGVSLDRNGEALLKNTTISGNDTFGLSAGLNANAILVHVTIAANAGGLFAYVGADIALRNTILAGNGDHGDCDVKGDAFLSAVGSLLGKSCSDSSLSDPWLVNLIGVEPKLAGLAPNGGLTWTHALLPGSPAIDAAGSGHCLPTDQRGTPRPLDGNGDGWTACDIGAYERSLSHASPGGRGDGGGRG
jgi:hypothetical protein